MAIVNETSPAAVAAPAPRARPVSQDQRVAFAASWEFYLALTEAVGDQHVRIAYDGQRIEIMSPGPDHEDYKEAVACLVRALAFVAGLPCKGTGSTRRKRPEALRGLEPDTSFYLTPEKIAVARSRPKSPSDDPMPDLAVEIDVSRPEVDRMGIYAALGVPEVWRFDGETAWIDRPGPDGSLVGAAESGFFPGFRPEDLAFLLTKVAAEAEDDNDFSLRVTAWARANLAPRPGA